MKQKIEWYKEVLELEPGSRVFFPLAKLLAADGQAAEAVFTLKQGLLRHPDHVEARLLLVELLHLQNAGPELQGELDGLGNLFASYPGFWSAWSERLSATPALHDASLAMRFFAAALQGRQVSWAAIIEQGLQSMLSAGATQEASPAFSPPVLSAQEAAAMSSRPAPPQEQPSQPTVDSHAESSRNEHDTVVNVQATKEEAASEQQEALPEEEDGEEAFSLRTRSMAEVLAEQGDIAGALDIYQELMQSADDEEKALLLARAEELSRRTGTAQTAEESAEEKVPATGGESTRLVTLLESLAQRLEARSR